MGVQVQHSSCMSNDTLLETYVIIAQRDARRGEVRLDKDRGDVLINQDS